MNRELIIKSMSEIIGKTVLDSVQCSCSSWHDEPEIIKFTDGSAIFLQTAYEGEEVVLNCEPDSCCLVSSGIKPIDEYNAEIEQELKKEEKLRESRERIEFKRLTAKFSK